MQSSLQSLHLILVTVVWSNFSNFLKTSQNLIMEIIIVSKYFTIVNYYNTNLKLNEVDKMINISRYIFHELSSEVRTENLLDQASTDRSCVHPIPAVSRPKYKPFIYSHTSYRVLILYTML